MGIAMQSISVSVEVSFETVPKGCNRAVGRQPELKRKADEIGLA